MKSQTDYPQEDRDQQILRRLANIEHRVDSLGQTTAFALRADAEKHFDTVRKIFGKSKRKVQVYLAADGTRSVLEIAELLMVARPNVSKYLIELQEDGLLEISENARGKTYYCKKPIDKTIRISSLLQKEFDLDKDGLSNK